MKAKIKAVLFPQPYSNGEYPIYIRIYSSGKSNYIKTGYSIVRGAWNDEQDRVYESMPSLNKKLKESLSPEEIQAFKEMQKQIIVLPNAAKINSDIRKLISSNEAILTKLEINDEEVSSVIIKTKATNKDKDENAKKDFLLYIEDAAKKKYLKKQIRTSEKYNVMLKKLKAFLKDKPLPISKLTTGFLTDFQLYLQKEGSHPNYEHSMLKQLRTIIQKEAIKEDRILTPDKNPFVYFTMPKLVPTHKERLELKEIEDLENLTLAETDILYHIRNSFLFSIYNAGIRIGDLLQLKWVNISGGRLTYYMRKTGKERSIKLLPQAQKILKVYEEKREKETDYIFPFLENNAEYAKLITRDDFLKAAPELIKFLYKNLDSKISMINSGLKEIAKQAEITKPISTHVSRHSFADIARKKDISIYDISKMLGHSNITVTQGYIKSLDYESMDDAMEKVFK